MKLATDSEIAKWLSGGPLLQWDDGNSTKSESKHGFSTADVEDMLRSPVLFAGRIVEPAHSEPRYLILGVASPDQLPNST